MPFKPVQTAKCPKCGQSVYAAEEVMVSNNKYHRGCFKCYLCNKMLELQNVTPHGVELYCKACYGKKYGPKGFRGGGGVGATSSVVNFKEKEEEES